MPIGLGFLINLIIYIVCKNIYKTKPKVLKIIWSVAFITLFSSFIIGRWIGMGIGVISLGMILAAIVFSLYELSKSNQS